MCLQDIAIAQRCKSRTRRITMTGSAVQILTADKSRLQVLISLPVASLTAQLSVRSADGNLASIWSTDRTTTATQATMTEMNVYLDIRTHGPVIQEELWLSSSNAGPAGVTDVVMLPDLADAVKKEMKRAF